MSPNPGAPRRLVVVGSVVVDLVMAVDELPRRGDDIRADTAHAEIGGGFAALATAGRHGMATALAGRHGTGPFGAAVAAALTAEGVEVLLPASTEADSGFRAGFVEPGGEHMSVTSTGVEADLDRDTLGRLPIGPADAVYVSGHDLTYPRTGRAIARWVADLPRQALVVFDPGQRVDEVAWPVAEQVLVRSDVVTMGTPAARRLLGTGRGESALRALHEYAPRLRTGLLRRGADGCWVSQRRVGAPVEVPAPPMDVTYSPDSGGVHTGALLAGLARGCRVSRAALRANVAVALHGSRRRRGAYPDAAAVDDFLATRWSGG